MKHRVIDFRTIDSTNSEAQRRVLNGEIGPIWLKADQQNRGRGRSGRAWVSPIGNLSATLVFQPGCQLADFHQLSFLSGLAAFDTIKVMLERESCPAQPELKWPNDVLIDKRKVGGILVECSSRAYETVAIMGFGMNLAVTPQIGGRDATCLGEHVTAPTSDDFLRELDRAVQVWLEVWARGTRFDDIRRAWLERAHPVGTELAINTNLGRVSGEFHGLERDGALLLRETTGSVRAFHFGDVAIAKGLPERNS